MGSTPLWILERIVQSRFWHRFQAVNEGLSLVALGIRDQHEVLPGHGAWDSFAILRKTPFSINCKKYE